MAAAATDTATYTAADTAADTATTTPGGGEGKRGDGGVGAKACCDEAERVVSQAMLSAPLDIFLLRARALICRCKGVVCLCVCVCVCVVVSQAF